MGYYVEGEGVIAFERFLSENEIQKIKTDLEILNPNFAGIDSHDPSMPEYDDRSVVYLSYEGNYYSDNVEKALNSALDVPISVGLIEFVGDDVTFWRFIYQDGEWKYQDGRVVYD